MTARPRTRIEDLMLVSPVWAALPGAARAELAARAVRRSVKRGDRIVRATDRTVVTLVTGRADLVSTADDTVIRGIGPPVTLGISVALGGTASAEVWARTACELIVIPGDAVAATIRRHPDAAVAALIHLGAVIADLSETLEAMRRHGLVHRLRHAIAELARGRRELTITHDQLAATVGGARANVSRALARLEAEGFLRRKRGRLELAD